jgi:hypothetical protein
MNTCEQCGREYRPTKHWQRFCDNECRKDWHLHQYHLRRRGMPTQRQHAEEVLELAGVAVGPTNGFVRRF